MNWMERLSEKTGVQIGPAVNLGPVTDEQRRESMNDEYRTGLDAIDQGDEDD